MNANWQSSKVGTAPPSSGVMLPRKERPGNNGSHSDRSGRRESRKLTPVATTITPMSNRDPFMDTLYCCPMDPRARRPSLPRSGAIGNYCSLPQLSSTDCPSMHRSTIPFVHPMD